MGMIDHTAMTNTVERRAIGHGNAALFASCWRTSSETGSPAIPALDGEIVLPLTRRAQSLDHRAVGVADGTVPWRILEAPYPSAPSLLPLVDQPVVVAFEHDMTFGRREHRRAKPPVDLAVIGG